MADSGIEAVRYSDSHRSDWESLVAASSRGAYQHRRAFLDRHGGSFVDESLVFFEGREMVGLLPAAPNPASESEIVSHPGSSYGGLVFLDGLPPSRVPELVSLAISHFIDGGYDALTVRPAWPWLAPRIDDTFDHELLRRGAVAHPWQLVSVLPLKEGTLSLRPRRRRALRKALGSVEIRWGMDLFEDFWPVLEDRLSRSHGVSPVHSADDVLDIHHRCPSYVDLATAWSGTEIVGGILLFEESSYSHAQYIAASDTGRRIGATDALVDAVSHRARIQGRRYLSLGSSLDPLSRSINSGLLDFKSEFGASNFMIPSWRLEFIAGELEIRQRNL